MSSKRIKKEEPEITTSYLSRVYYPVLYKKHVKETIDAVRKYKKKNPVDAIAFTGTSGAAYAYPVSLAVGLPLICVRKPGSQHYGTGIEGCRNAKSYIIIDDFISSGATLRRIIKMVKKTSHEAQLKAIFLYSDDRRRKAWKDYPVISI